MKIHILKWRIERDHSVSLWMKDVFDQQHLLISSFVSFLNTAISKRGRVKSSTTQDWRGGARQSNPGPLRGHYKSAGAFFWRWKTTLAKKKKRAALMARSKKRAASSKSDKSNTSWLQLWERTPRQDKDWVGFSRVGNETTFMEWVEAKPPALFESQGL